MGTLGSRVDDTSQFELSGQPFDGKDAKCFARKIACDPEN